MNMLTLQIHCKVRQRRQLVWISILNIALPLRVLHSPFRTLSDLAYMSGCADVGYCGFMMKDDSNFSAHWKCLPPRGRAPAPADKFHHFSRVFVGESSLLFAERAPCHQEEAWIDHERCVGHKVAGARAEQLHLLLQHGLGRPLTWHTM